MTLALRTVCLVSAFSLTPFSLRLGAADIDLTDFSHLDFRNALAEPVTYRGRPPLKMTEKDGAPGSAYAIVKGLSFHDGTIELEVSGAPSKTADPTARGFIGVMFRVQPDGTHCESIYLRPTNGRAEDQLQRNHAVQYVSPPEWDWKRLRDETPGQYESYVDMQAGEWTRMRIVVHGKRVALYVGGAEQPCLIVRDMKLGDSQGGVALWIGPGTEGYFRGLAVTPAPGEASPRE
jgi:hypothetical protein